MTVSLLCVLIGGILVLWGADRLTEGAVNIARHLNVPQIFIGLTIVAFGTSLPEFFVSMVSALKGNPDLAVGNIVGSNIFNAMAIIGVAAWVAPISIRRTTVRIDMPFAVFSSLILTLVCYEGLLSRLESFFLVMIFILFMVYIFRTAKGEDADEVVKTTNGSVAKSVVYMLIGIVCLVGGSNVFVSGATEIAYQLGVSQAVIGLTIVAIGTSLPELATSVVAAIKGQSGLAIGNVVGSNVFNILFILGVTGTIHPMRTSGITKFDMIVMVVSMLLLWLFSFTKYKVSRVEGAVLTFGYVAYMAWLVYSVL